MTDTEILALLPATYSQIAAALGVNPNTLEGYISRMRRRGYNIRAVGRNRDFVLELIPGVVKLDAPKLRSWKDL